MTDSGMPGLAWRTLKNSIYSLIGFAWPLAIALVVSPYIVHKLGTDLYGVLSIVGVTLGFFGFLDFGIGGAATRQIAAYYAKEEHDNVSRVVSCVLAFYLAIGLVVGALILALTNVLVTRLLGIPEALQQTATAAFYIAAPSFLTSLVAGAFMSVPSALQRYDISTKFGIVLTTINTMMTVAVLAAGYGIVAVMLGGLVVTLVALPVEYAIARRMVPSIRLRAHWDPPMLKELFSFGGYFLLSSVGVLLLYQADKLIIGGMLGVAAVTYYVIPSNLAQKIQGVIGSTTNVLFPLSAALFESSKRDTLIELYREGTRLVLIFVAIMAVPLAVFSGKFLTYWMGPDIAQQSSVPMLLLVGTYAALALSGVPWGIANGSGRAKINAVFTLAIAATDIALLFVLVRPYGVAGAAAAYLISAVVGVPLLICYIERSVLGLSGFVYLQIGWRIMVVALLQIALAVLVLPLASSFVATVSLMMGSAVSFGVVYWALGFVREGDRRLILLIVGRFRS